MNFCNITQVQWQQQDTPIIKILQVNTGLDGFSFIIIAFANRIGRLKN